MERLSEQEQRDLIGAVEQAIVLSRTVHPNDAILKVAAERQYNPQFVSRMVEAFNKSKTVHVLKEAKGDDRARPFDIADTAWILQQMYAPVEKAAAVELPKGGRPEPVMMEKAASAIPNPIKDPELRARMLKQAEDAYVHVCRRVMDQLHAKVQEHKYAFDTALERIVEEMAPMGNRRLQKVAQHIIDGYPTTGPGLLAILSNRLNRKLPDIEKMGCASIFPNREPYLSLAELYLAAEKLARAEIEEREFEKNAEDGIISGIASRSLAATLAGMGVAPETIEDVSAAGRKKEGDDVLDPDFYNKLKSLDVKRSFLSLALYDPDLKQYDFSALRRAYNNVVSSVPNAYQNPVVLKNLMLRNLQSSGVKDPYELKQELDIGKAMDESGQNREKMQLEREKVKALTKQAPPVRTPFEASKKSLFDSVGERLGEVSDISLKAHKERQENEDRAAKAEERVKKP